MPNADGKYVIALLALPESTGSTLYGMFDVLESAGRDWSILVGGLPGEPAFATSIVSADGRPRSIGNGLWMQPHAALEDCPAPDVVAIPDIMVGPDEPLAGRYPAEIEWLKALHARGATLATACTGALLLAEAGLLDGYDATTHWAYCDAMAARYPHVRVHVNRPIVVAGAGQRLLMAGGGTSWHDLALYLIARLVGPEEAMRVARLHLLDWHHVGQQPFASLTRARQVDDALIAKCQEWVARHYEERSPVAAMARLSGLAERSFKRRFARATGIAPLEYVQTLRLEEAKHLLETGNAPIEEIALAVGYEDPSFFGRLFRRKVGLTPAQYRKRFRALRVALEPQSVAPGPRLPSEPAKPGAPAKFAKPASPSEAAKPPRRLYASGRTG